MLFAAEDEMPARWFVCARCRRSYPMGSELFRWCEEICINCALESYTTGKYNSEAIESRKDYYWRRVIRWQQIIDEYLAQRIQTYWRWLDEYNVEKIILRRKLAMGTITREDVRRLRVVSKYLEDFSDLIMQLCFNG